MTTENIVMYEFIDMKMYDNNTYGKIIFNISNYSIQ